MKVLKEVLLLNDLKSTLDVAKEEPILVMRNDEEPIMMMSLQEYNQLKAEAYKKSE